MWARVLAYARAAFFGRHAQLGARVKFGPGVRCIVAPGGRLIIGDDVEIGAVTSLNVGPGASMTIGNGVFIAGNCILAASGEMMIGSDSMFGELVSVRDHDHDPAFPPKSGRILQGDVWIGERVGAKATVTRGVTVGDDAVIGAHALVNSDVPAASLAVGVPARVKRTGIRQQ